MCEENQRGDRHLVPRHSVCDDYGGHDDVALQMNHARSVMKRVGGLAFHSMLS